MGQENLKAKLLGIVNEIREDAGLGPVSSLSDETELRKDLQFDSLALATLTVRVEDEFGVDVFEDGIVRTIGEILRKIG